MFQLTIIPAILVAAVLATAIPQPGSEVKETLIDQVKNLYNRGYDLI
jgi:hypothetical protein